MTLQEFLEQEGERVIQKVCFEHRVGKVDLLSRSTSPHFVRARRAVIRLLAQSGFNKNQIARALGRSRSTIDYWLRPAEREHRRNHMREYFRKQRRLLEICA
jgi:transposase-like protein